MELELTRNILGTSRPFKQLEYASRRLFLVGTELTGSRGVGVGTAVDKKLEKEFEMELELTGKILSTNLPKKARIEP